MRRRGYLRVDGGRLYVGHTDDLDRRLEQHSDATRSSYTGRIRPKELAWLEEFPSREEALARELQIKKWSRNKKEALIAGDWSRVKALARCHGEHGKQE